MTTMSIACARGMAAHAIMPDVLAGQNWRRMMRLKSGRLLGKLGHAIRRTDEYLDAYRHLQNQRQHDAWIADCYTRLFDLYQTWQVQNVMVEPDLGAIILDNGYNLRFGMPDNLFFSPQLNGLVGVEIKTGEKKRRPQNSKVMRYQLGLLRFAQQHNLPALRAINWVSFADNQTCRRTGIILPARRPVLNTYSIPLQVKNLSDWCLGTYGYTLSELTDLSRFPTISTKQALALAT